MATRAEIQQIVDDKLTSLWGTIQTFENNYFASNNRYWQGLRTHTIVPSEGVESATDVGTRTPSDIQTAWPLAIRNSTLPCTLEIHAYDGPLGKGYVVMVTVQVLEIVYSRAKGVGPEDRDQAWRRL